MINTEKSTAKTDYKEYFFCIFLFCVCTLLFGCGGKPPIPSKSNYADTTSEQAYSFSLQGRYVESIKLYSIALKEYQRIDDQPSAARTSANLSIAYYETGNFDKARDLTNQALLIYNLLNDKENILKLKVNLAVILIQLEDPSARQILGETLNMLPEKKSLRARCLICLSLLNLKENIETSQLINEAESIFKNTQDNSGMAAVYFTSGISSRNNGDFKKSAEFFNKALEIDKKQRSTITVLRDLEELAITYESIDINLAKEYYIRALGIAKFYNMKDKIKKIETRLEKLK